VGQHLRAEAGKPDRDEQDTSALAEPDDAIGEQERDVDESEGWPLPVRSRY